MEKTAIVILNWNGEAMLKRFLPSVLEHSRNAAVYVADNASTDNSIEMLKLNFPEVKTIVLDMNYGFADGYNKALSKIDAEYFVLLNSDVEVTEGWLDMLIDFMDKNKDVAACQPKIRSFHNRESFEYAGASGGFIDKYGYPFCRGRVFDSIEKDIGQYDDIKDIFWATGACLVTRARIYNKVGGLDGRFFAHSEEIDFCWRLRLHGYRICCIPQSVVFHVGGGTLPKSNPHKTFLNFRNNLTMLYKNLPDKELRPVMTKRWILDHLAAFQTLILQRNAGDFRAIFKARREFKQWKHDFDKDRLETKELRNGKKIEERRNFLILWKYYAKRQKKFSQLH